MADISESNALDSLLCCDHFLVEANAKPSYIGVFRTINLQSLPDGIARFYCVAQLRNVRGSSLSLVINRPNGTRAQLGMITVEDAGQGKGINAVWEVNNLQFAEAGQHQLILEIDGDSIGEFTFDVSILGGNS